MDDYKKDTSLNGSSVKVTADKDDRDFFTALAPEQDTSLVSQPEHTSAAPSNDSRKKAIIFMNIFALTAVS